MNETFRIRFGFSRSDNRKSKIEKRPRRRKWAGLFPIVVALTVCGAVVQAQQAKKMPRIGYLHGGLKLDGTDESFHQGLHEFGYIEGKNVVLEYRYAKGKLDRFPELAADLARSKVDIIVAVSETGVRAAKNATQTMAETSTGTSAW